jgi:hypothetical protein
VSLCPDFPKDSEACRKKWISIYNGCKEDKAMNMQSGSDRSEKCQWYQLINEIISDRAHIVAHAHAHASATYPEAPKSTCASDVFTTEHKSGESSSKSPEPKRKEKIFFYRCINHMKESSKTLMDTLKASNDMKMSLLISMQQTMSQPSLAPLSELGHFSVLAKVTSSNPSHTRQLCLHIGPMPVKALPFGLGWVRPHHLTHISL